MTRSSMKGSTNSETTTVAEQFRNDPVEEPTEANLSWLEETIVKTEIIILPDDLLPTIRCRLCDSPDHVCSPIYNLRGGIELTEKHLEIIYRLSGITITYEQDHASVVCSYCLLKIEEYKVIREVWQMKNKTDHESNVPALQPAATLISYVEKTGMKDATTQTTEHHTFGSALDVRDASTWTDNCEPAQAPVSAPEHIISVTENGDKDCDTQCETIDVEQYCSRRKRKRRRSKCELIEEVMQLVKRRYRLESGATNR
ncbi:uncharacterized protein LOC128718057 [Anopheles marshallii]|uniref:uncharacterized protein LOC128718057 n=1 Tax=Anopheles marshallii TaxID=1521116 RepID=UPI00237B9F86|nr:uncharacterized protein LOC128718057 [Anopheles marshallii]